MNRDTQNQDKISRAKELFKEGQKLLNADGEKTFFCHYFNNYKDCPWDKDCRYSHEYAKNCSDDGDCRRKLCPFQHPREFQSFLGMGPMKGIGGSHRDSDVRPFRRFQGDIGRGFSPYEIRRRQANW